LEPWTFKHTASSRGGRFEDWTMEGLISVHPARDVTIVGCVLPICTILTCWIIALSLGHVALWPWPMISDCGCETPEKWIFRLGLTVSSTFLVREAFLVRDYIKRAAMLSGRAISGTSPEDVSVYLATIASFGLAGCATVSENEQSDLHGALAVMFFVFDIAYMFVISWRINSLDAVHFPAQTIKKVLSVIAASVFVVFVIVNAMGLPQWTQAIAEWVGTIVILLFNGSFCYEFGNKMFIADGYSDTAAVATRETALIQDSVPLCHPLIIAPATSRPPRVVAIPYTC